MEIESFFDTNSNEESLDGKIGSKKVLDLLFNQVLKLPEGFTIEDLSSMIDGIEVPTEFTKETFLTYYNDCIQMVKNDLIPEPEKIEGDEELLPLTPNFIAERLSDLQELGGENLSFAFTSFIVHEADISDVTELNSFHSLNYISLKNNKINNIISLSGLSNLTELYLNENKIVTFNNINLPKLKILDLTHNKICNIENLNLPNLQKLILNQNTIIYISPNAFNNLKLLEELDLSQNKLRNFKSNTFQNLINLKKFKLDQNSLTELPENCFEGLNSLEYLNIGENSLDNIIGLIDLINLKKLDMHQTAIMKLEDLNPLIDLKNLQSIIFDGTPCSSLESFKLEILLLIPWIEFLDEENISFSDRQESLELKNERTKKPISKDGNINNSINQDYNPQNDNPLSADEDNFLDDTTDTASI